MPRRSRPTKPRKQRKYPLEKVIQKSILAWLKSTGLLFWRQNSGFIPVGPRKVWLGIAGLPDIIVVVPPGGRFVGLEVKSQVGRQSDVQKAFQDVLTASGGSYYIVRTREDAMNAVAKELGEHTWKLLQSSI